jgi:hypothetical protein
MAIEGIGATIKKDSVLIGEVVDINLPDDEAKEYETTNLSDTREQFKLSAMSVGQIVTITIRLNPESPAVVKGESGAYEIDLPKQTSGSSAGANYAFNAYNRMVSGGALTTAGSEGITQEVTYRLTSEVTFTAES